MRSSNLIIRLNDLIALELPVRTQPQRIFSRGEDIQNFPFFWIPWIFLLSPGLFNKYRLVCLPLEDSFLEKSPKFPGISKKSMESKITKN
jgi:hypothetical protein